MTYKYNQTFCVQVKNKPCVKYTTIMRLISWINTRGSKTMAITAATDNFLANCFHVVKGLSIYYQNCKFVWGGLRNFFFFGLELQKPAGSTVGLIHLPKI
jgi:hypothetical protein